MTTALSAALTLTIAGCGVLERELPDEVPNTARERTGVLQVAEWGVTDGLLSVRVQNDSTTVLERADATIVVELSGGESVAARGSAPQDLCCTLLDVPRGQDFGLYVDLGERADLVEDVDVSYSEVSWAPAADPADVPEITVDEPVLADTTSSTEVRTRVTVDEDVDVLAAQVFLNGPDGEFLAVVSGRFRCFTAGDPRQVVVELFHPVPDGTEVESMVTYPLSTPTADAAGSCK